jgi:ribosomal protein S18 acetylase RimI-like enzyme
MNVQSLPTIRPLGLAEIGPLQTLRLEALLRQPEAFRGDFAQEAQMAPETFAKLLLPSPPGVMFGSFADGQLVGMAGLGVPTSATQRHKGRIFGMYVQPLHRNQRHASRLLEAAIAQAGRARLVMLTVSVTTNSPHALRLYAAHGFRSVGTIRRSVKMGSQYFDEQLMQLDLDAA